MKQGLITDDDGTKRYYLNNLLHRVNGPAEIWANGTKFWVVHGENHRVAAPAMEWADGSKLWFVHDKLHREDGPAMEWADGSKLWYLHNKRLIHPKEFETMEEWFQKLKTDENYSLPFINNINGIIAFIKNPTPKQKRLHAMKWKL